MVSSIQGNALAGIQQARNNMQKNAMDIARANQTGSVSSGLDPARSLVEMNQNKSAAQASMKVLQAEDRMLGSLLDVIA